MLEEKLFQSPLRIVIHRMIECGSITACLHPLLLAALAILYAYVAEQLDIIRFCLLKQST